MSDTPQSAGEKRKRPVTTCWECYRRKQKCNRQQPCNICLARGVEEKCFYGEEHAHTIAVDEVRLAKRARDDVTEAMILEEQLGYSSLNNSNVLFNLDESLRGPKRRTGEPIALSLAHREDYDDIVSQLPSEFIQQELTSIFFAHSLWWFSGLDPFYFRRIHQSWHAERQGQPLPHYDEVTPHDLIYFPCLLFQTLAVAIQFLPSAATKTRQNLAIHDLKSADKVAARYSRLGLSLTDLLGRHRSCLVAVQSDIARGIWLKNSSRGTESWYSLGQALRQAQGLGLHLEPKATPPIGVDIGKTLQAQWYDEYKKRTWIVIFTWDAHMALILGRPRMVCVEDCTIQEPLDTNIPADPSQVVPIAAAAQKTPSSITPMIFQYRISHLIHEMVSSGADRPSFQDYRVVATIHRKTAALLERLPGYMRPDGTDTSFDEQLPFLKRQRKHTVSSANSFIMALHRPHAADHPCSRAVAIEAALNVLNAQKEGFALAEKTAHRIYSYSFHSIDAAIFLSVMLIDRSDTLDDGTIARIDHALHHTIERMSVLKEISPMARSGEQLLLRCYERLKQSIPSRLPSVPVRCSDDSVRGIPALPPDFVAEAVSTTEVGPSDDSVARGSCISLPEADFNVSFQHWQDQLSLITGMDASLGFDGEFWDNLGF